MTRTAADRAAEAARMVVESEGVYLRTRGDPFFFTSGWASPIFIDIKQLVSRPAAREALVGLVLEQIAESLSARPFDFVAGCELAGIPFAAIIADRLRLPLIVVRKQSKGFGRLAQFEGAFEVSARALLIDDVSTDGLTKETFRVALERAEAQVAETFVLLDYDVFPQLPSVRPLTSLMRLTDVVAALSARGGISGQALAEIEAFAADAPAWSRRNGGIEALPTQ